MMQLFVVLLAIVAVVQAETWTRKSQDDIWDAHIECIAKNPISEENVAEMKRFEYPDEESVRKYIQCIAETLKFFNTNTGYYSDRIIEQFKGHLPEAEVENIVHKCLDKNEQGSPADVWAFRTHICLKTSKLSQFAREYMKKTLAS